MNDNSLDRLEREVIARLATNLLRIIGQHYRDRPTSRDTVFEILNALAMVTATVCQGAGDDKAMEFFLEALRLQREQGP